MADLGATTTTPELLSTAMSKNRERLIRYINRKFVDSFFAKGELLLTTYQKCRKHEDATRRDAGEGKVNFYIESEGYAVSVAETSGDNSYMLCTSLVEDDALARHFNVDSCIRINDPSGFFEEVSKTIPRLQSSRLDQCSYIAERSESKVASSPIRPNATKLLDAIAGGNDFDLDRLYNEMHEDFSRRVGDELSEVGYFSKPESFKDEKEFRMVWTMDQPAVDGLLIYCPEAIKYCEAGPSF